MGWCGLKVKTTPHLRRWGPCGHSEGPRNGLLFLHYGCKVDIRVNCYDCCDICITFYLLISSDIISYHLISFVPHVFACEKPLKYELSWIIILITESKWLNPNEGLYTPKSCRLATWVALAVNMMHQEGASDLSSRGMMILAASLPHPTTPAGPVA